MEGRESQRQLRLSLLFYTVKHWVAFDLWFRAGGLGGLVRAWQAGDKKKTATARSTKRTYTAIKRAKQYGFKQR
jgi:hypothetical protein